MSIFQPLNTRIGSVKSGRIVIVFFLLIVITVPLLFPEVRVLFRRNTFPPPPMLIAHGGSLKMVQDGKEKDFFVTNSLEGLELKYAAGHQLFEADFNWTKDNQLVMMHDWGETYRLYFPNAPKSVPTLEQFESATMINNLHQLSLPKLNQWLRDHPNSFIVTDVKVSNVDALREIVRIDPELARTRYIPQIYRFEEYEPVAALGMKNIILTLYGLDRSKISDQDILDFVSRHPLYALTMPGWSLLKPATLEELKKRKVFVYVHPVLDLKSLMFYRKLGIEGFYCSFLVPKDVAGIDSAAH